MASAPQKRVISGQSSKREKCAQCQRGFEEEALKGLGHIVPACKGQGKGQAGGGAKAGRGMVKAFPGQSMRVIAADVGPIK